MMSKCLDCGSEFDFENENSNFPVVDDRFCSEACRQHFLENLEEGL